MANIPEKYTQEAEASRARDKKIAASGMYQTVFKSACIRNCAVRDKKCDDCIRFSEYIETKSK